MKRLLTIGPAMLAGAAIGALAVQGLHAQSKPPIYYVSQITVTNPDAYAKEYAPKAQAIIKAHGGKLVAIGGVAGNSAQPIVSFDGDTPQRAVVQVWDSMDQIKAWRADPDYQALRKVGDQYAKFQSFAIPGVAQ
jgi:uncharacterized protein (DUF1330 family)